jgi:hypothetical protein
MIVKIDRSFEKDTDKLRDKKLLIAIVDCLTEANNAKNITEIRNLKK